MTHADPNDSLRARDSRCTWHPYTQHGIEREFLPVVFAIGSILELEDGRELIDAISSWWTCLHGHGHPKLIEAMRAQAETLDHVLFAGCTHEPAVALAEKLVALAPKGLSRVFYSDDGSTAIEVALKIVLQSWRQRGEDDRRTFVALEGAYHGDTFGAMAVGDREPFFHAFAPLLFDVKRAAVDAKSIERALDELGNRAAGVILEPLVQGAAGMRMQPIEFVRDVRRVCSERDVPLIADEVMTGFGRTGSLFACSKAGVAPDLLCLSKGLTGGLLPLSATLATERLFDDFRSTDRAQTFFHGHSFTANPIGCAVALASLELCVANDVPSKLDAIGARIERALAPLARNPKVRELRRTGGIVALELADLVSYGSHRSYEWRARAIELGVLLRPLGNVLYALPPASTTDEQCDTIARALAALATE